MGSLGFLSTGAVRGWSKLNFYSVAASHFGRAFFSCLNFLGSPGIPSLNATIDFDIDATDMARIGIL